MISFSVSGRRHQLTRAQVEGAVVGLEPEPIQSLAVKVGGRWWPAKQPFVAALGLRNTDVNSRTAMRNLERLGFESHDMAAMGVLPDLSERTPRPGLAGSGEGDRRLAISLATELGAALHFDADVVLETAARFEAWLAR